MRITIHLIIASLYSSCLVAQIEQKGIAVEINSNKKPVGQVMISVKDAQPTYSDDNGLFSFTIEGTTKGRKIIVYDVSKPEYIIINKEEIYGRWIVSEEANPWLFKVEVAHKDSIQFWEGQYRQLAELNSKNELEKQIAHLKTKLNAQEISKNEFSDKIYQLEENNKKLKEQFHYLAERFAYINRDFALSFVNKALDAYRDGIFDLATQLLDSCDIIKELEIADHILQTRKGEAAKAHENIRQFIEAAIIKARLYNIQFNLDSANYYYERALFYDNSSYNNYVEYSLFLEVRLQRYKDAIHYLNKAISHAWNDYEKAFAHAKIGMIKCKLNHPFNEAAFDYFKALEYLLDDNSIDLNESRLASSIFTKLGKLQKDVRYYRDAEESYWSGINSARKIAELNNSAYDRLTLASMLSELGELQLKMRKSSHANGNLTIAINLFNSLNNADSIDYCEDYIKALNTKSGIELALNNTHNAGIYIYEAIDKCMECLRKDSLRYKEALSMSLYSLGKYKMQINEADSAVYYLNESLSIIEWLAYYNPDVHNPQFATVLKDLAIARSNQNQNEIAERYFNKSISISRDLALYKPEVYNVHISDVLMKLSEHYKQTGQYLKAEEALLESLFICYNLKNYWADNYDFELFYAYQQLYELAILGQELPEAEIYLSEALLFCNSLLGNGLAEFEPEKEKLLKQLKTLQKNKTKANTKGSKRNNKKNECEIALVEIGNSGVDNTDEENNNANKSNWLGSLSYFLILEQNYRFAEYFAIKALKLYPSQSWVKTNLALSLLLQDRFNEAKQIYLELKEQQYPLITGKTFRQIFIQDLDEIEMKGFKHPDFINARKLLSN